MYILKAFACNEQYYNNVPGTISNIGQLSTQSLTYSRNTGNYASDTNPNVELVTFTSNLDSATYTPTQDLITSIVNIVSFIYQKATPIAVQLFSDILLQNLLTQFASVANNFECGAIINNGSFNMPEWVSWTITDNAAIGVSNSIKIWFSDTSFQAQFDDFQIVVIPPFSPVDQFYSGTNNIKALLTANTPTVLMENIQTAKNNNPETIIVGTEYNFVDQSVGGVPIPTTWYAVIYGIAGNTIDNIQNAIINYILSNTTNTQASWTTIFPTIFKRTEFIIVPNWDQYAIPNKTLAAGIYSPSISVVNALKLLTNTIPAYPVSHINANADIVAQPYKSLCLATIGNPDNINDIYNVSGMFPDYIDIPSTSLDFSRMSQTTQDFANMLVSMLIIAETMSEYTTVPNTMGKVTRNNILYLVNKFNNIDYLVAAKANF